MQLKKLTLANFMSYDNAQVELPLGGVIAITGPNGSGKSALMEGLAWALWGKTLRGESPVADESRACVVTAEMDDGLCVTRSRKGAKAVSVKVKFSDGTTLDGATASHAQTELEHVIGSFDSWRRTRAFSSQDAAHFSMATDAERKKLLEGILDLERFDEALKACRAELSTANRAAEDARRRFEVQEARAQEIKIRLEDARKGLDSITQVDGGVSDELANTTIVQSNLEITNIGKKMRELQSQMRASQTEASNAKASADEADRGLARLKAAQCPACAQDIPTALRDKWNIAAAVNRKVANDMAKATAEACVVIEGELRDYQTLLDAARAEVSRLTSDMRAREGQRSAAASFRAIVERVEAEIGLVGAVLGAAKQGYEANRLKAAKLAACEMVLGLRGVRSQVLAKALPGIEAAANAWLARIAGEGVTISLSSSSELKSGDAVEKIGLTVHGFAGGRGYKSSSGGQRRRVDVALLLALADIAGAARARAPETLWLDEIADTLDDDGIESISTLLHELAAARTVVVVSHSDALLQALRADEHLLVNQGTIARQ